MSDFLSNIGNTIKDATMSPIVKAGVDAAESLKENSGGIFDEIGNAAKDGVVGQVSQFIADKLEDSGIIDEAVELFSDAADKVKDVLKNATISPIAQVGAALPEEILEMAKGIKGGSGLTEKLTSEEILEMAKGIKGDGTLSDVADMIKEALQNDKIAEIVAKLTEAKKGDEPVFVKDASDAADMIEKTAGKVKDVAGKVKGTYNKLKEATEPQTEIGKAVKEKTIEFINDAIEVIKEGPADPNPHKTPNI